MAVGVTPPGIETTIGTLELVVVPLPNSPFALLPHE
jgi:hypothetical protein